MASVSLTVVRNGQTDSIPRTGYVISIHFTGGFGAHLIPEQNTRGTLCTYKVRKNYGHS